MSTLKRSERNSIIEDYRNGVLNPNYEVIQTKTKGRYTVRRRKVPLTEEQLEQLSNQGANDEPEVVMPSFNQITAPINTPVKRSKKENALFDLQNQFNTQMLYRLNDLTNKVIKLKAWKKKMKQEMYEDDEESGSPAALPHTALQQIDKQSEATNVVSQIDEQSELPPSSHVQQIDEPDPQAYLGQIPQQYIEEEPVDTMPPQYMYGARSGIDYSKFGF